MNILLEINNFDQIKEIIKIIKSYYNNKVKVLDYGSFFFSCIIETQKKRYELTKLNDDYTVNNSYYDKFLEEYANKKIESIKGDDILVVYNSNRLFCLEKSILYKVLVSSKSFKTTSLTSASHKLAHKPI